MRTRLLTMALSLVLTGNAFAADVFQAHVSWPYTSTLYLTDEVSGNCPENYFDTRLEVSGEKPVYDCWVVDFKSIKILDRKTGKVSYVDPEAFKRVTE